MTRKRWMPWIATVVLVAGLAVVAAGCGSKKNSTTSSASSTPAGTSTSATSTTGKKIKVGLVTDIGGLNDRSFNHLADVGLTRAESQLGITGKVLTSSSNADYIPNLSTLAQQHYDLVIGVGFLMADAMDTVATKFPNTHFAIIDVDQTSMKDKPKNVRGLLFKEQEAGYLVGYLSGLVVQGKIGVTGAKNTVSSVGGQKIPPVDHYIAGFQAGAKQADPNVKTLNAYSQNFVAQDKCKEIALNQIAQGSDVVFQVAGGCGLGALDAAKTKGVWGIGVDADQAYIGPQVLTSALKKVDVAVFKTIQKAQDGTFTGGGNSTFTVANGGIGIGKISSKVPASMVDKVNKIQQQIASGAITNIPNTVK